KVKHHCCRHAPRPFKNLSHGPSPTIADHSGGWWLPTSLAASMVRPPTHHVRGESPVGRGGGRGAARRGPTLAPRLRGAAAARAGENGSGTYRPHADPARPGPRGLLAPGRE